MVDSIGQEVHQRTEDWTIRHTDKETGRNSIYTKPVTKDGRPRVTEFA